MSATAATHLQEHPAASIFPMMSGVEFTEFKADVEANGLRESIVLYEGKILDGRNRYRACNDLGIEPDFITMDDHDIGHNPVAYVMSANFHRRHLTESQRAMVAADAAKLFSAAATSRMTAGKASDQSAPVRLGKSAALAASAAGVSTRTVESALKVAKGGAEELSAAVRAGRLSVKVAEEVVRRIPDPKRQAAIVGRAARGSKASVNDKLVRREIRAALRRRDTTQRNKEIRNGVFNPQPPSHAAITAFDSLVEILRTMPGAEEAIGHDLRRVGEWIGVSMEVTI